MTPGQQTRRRWATPSGRVWALTAVLAVAALVAVVAELRVEPLLSSPTIPWSVLAVCFMATELFVIHVDVREETFSVSMMEGPLVVALFVLAGPAIIVARLVGSAVPMMTFRRQVPMKACLNLALYACETTAAVAAFHAVAGDAADVSPRTWVAALAAMMLANVVSCVGVMSAMRLHGANLRGRVQSIVVGAMVPPVANTCLALVAVTLLAQEPRSAWLLAGVAVVLVAAYRGYASLNHRYANLQRLYTFTQQVQGADVEVADILRGAAELMRAERASLVLSDSDGYRVWSTDAPAIVAEIDTSALEPLTREAMESGRILRLPSTSRSAHRAALGASGWRDCIVAPFTATGGLSAAIIVADRADDVSTFDRDDERLFATLTNHCAIALGHAQLLSQLRHDAAHDALTGLLNRTSFEASLREAIDLRRSGAKLAVLLLDMDRFKEVNDTLGHHAGDELLREVSRRLGAVFGGGATPARLGGDEFALLLPEVEGDDEAVHSARLVRDALRAPHTFGELTIDLNSTIGIAIAPDDGEEPALLLQRADVAMLSAKERTTGVELYRSDRDHHSVRRLTLATELRAAIEADDLAVHYQPKVDLATGLVCGVEALVRWPHPTRGMIPPDEFIPVAERTGAIRQLTPWVLQRALSDCAGWRREGLDFGVAVNVSTRDLLDRDLPTRLSGLLDAVHLPADRLTLEITESSLMNDFVATEEVLHALGALGLRIAIDDFGTGYSSLTYLKRLPVHEIKIDKSFVRALDSDAGDRAIVQSVVDLSANLGLSSVAEGVESAAALDVLTDLACVYGQGYFFSKPLPLAELRAWVSAPKPEMHAVARPVHTPRRRSRGATRRSV